MLRRKPLLANERAKTVSTNKSSQHHPTNVFLARTWNCPVCDKAALYENLVIDGYFQDVIASQKLGVDDNEIQLHPDGSWSTLANKPDLYNLETPKKGMQKVEVISDDLGQCLTCCNYSFNHNLKLCFRNDHRGLPQVDNQIEFRQLRALKQAFGRYCRLDLRQRRRRRRVKENRFERFNESSRYVNTNKNEFPLHLQKQQTDRKLTTCCQTDFEITLS